MPKGELRKLAAEGMLTSDILISSTQELGYATDEVAQIAKRTGQALGATGDLYFKISQNTEKLG